MEAATWTEKYRPTTLGEIRNQMEIVGRLKKFAETRAMPHCLFAGPPGTGKTTASLCLAHDLFGERYADAFMELNASDSRGIDIIRTTVKEFARIATISGLPFKILVLDEADNMTGDAQHALRRTMERFTETCRFILCCNYSGRIIEPIQSRCAIFRFTPLKEDDVIGYLKEIAQKEKVQLLQDGLKAIVKISEGDLRKAVNTLQASASLGKAVDEKAVFLVAGQAKPEDVKEMLDLALGGDFVEARNKLRTMLVEYGLSGVEIIKQVHSEIFGMKIPEKKKVNLADIVGEVDFRISQGADEEVQLSAMLARLALVAGELGKK
jgi:replication factor C small subunit